MLPSTMALYKKICKLLDVGAENISVQLGNFIACKLSESKTLAEAEEWFKSSEGHQYIHKYVCIGMELLPKKPKKTSGYTLFSRETKPGGLAEGRAWWKALADVDQQRYNRMAEDQYQAAVAKFIELFEGDAIASDAERREARRLKAAEARARKKAATISALPAGAPPRGRKSESSPRSDELLDL